MSPATTSVTFGKSGLPGYEVGDKALPAVIIIQEWWGVTEACKEIAGIISDHGFRVLIPDLYKGKSTVEAEEAAHLMGALDFKAAVGEISEACEYLKATGSPKVAIAGFCMGGALTLAAASEGVAVCAAAPFYGIPDARYFDRTTPRQRRYTPKQRTTPRQRRYTPKQRTTPRQRRYTPKQRTTPRQRRYTPKQRTTPRQRRYTPKQWTTPRQRQPLRTLL